MGFHVRLALVLFVTLAACNRKTTSPPSDPQANDGGGASTNRTTASAGVPSLPMATGSGRFAIPGRSEAAIEVVVPEHRAKNPALLIAFHATGEEPASIVESFDLVAKAEALGFVAIAPRAGYRDTKHPPDVDHPADWGGSSWNMWTAADKNEDLAYVRSLIDAAKKSWAIDGARVYTAGFSNGAYFSYYVAASMPDRIAGFAEMSGGWATDACPTRTDEEGTSQYVVSMNAPVGKDLACATIFADPRFATKCRVTASNKLRPPVPLARVPFGYIAHYSTDEGVSVAWSCLLAEALGARAKTKIRARDADGTSGHAVMPNFIEDAFKFFAGRTVAQ
jgi:predicted esterase